MPSLLDISILVAGGLFLPILLPCFLQGPLPVFDGLLPGVMDSAYLAHPMTEHVFLIDMGKNLTLVLLGVWAYLQPSVATKKGVATLMSIQNLWAGFIAHGLASPEMMAEPYLKRVFGQPVLVAVCLGPAALMVAAILTTPDAKGKKK